jgi:glucose/mannose transport system permease protein
MPRSIADWAILGALGCFLLVFLMPLYLMVVTGLKDATNVSLSSMWNLPAYLSGGGFSEAWKRLWPSMVNSLFMTI